MLKKILILVLCTLVIAGYSGSTLNFTVQFNEIVDLRKSNPVYFETIRIGIVNAIEYTDTGDYRVQVAVENQYASLPKDSSTYYIDTDPENYAQKALRIIQVHEGGQVLKQNALVNGQSKYAVIYDQITNKFRKNLRVMESEITELFRDLQSLSEEEQIKQLENQLEKILDDIENLSTQVKKKLETEILPRIKEQLDDLKGRLKQNGREEKLNDAEEKLDKINAKFYI